MFCLDEWQIIFHLTNDINLKILEEARILAVLRSLVSWTRQQFSTT